MGVIRAANVTMIDYECWVCGIPFSVPRAWRDEVRVGSGTLYCPKGCRLGLGESETEKLRKQLVAKDAELDQARAARDRQHDRAERIQREKSALRGVITKTKKRIGNGVCPCCQRTFKQLARHMKNKHPEYVEA